MKVLVSDTSALVDLERGSLLDATFRLPFEFTVPDLLYERELKGHGGEGLLERGMRIAALDGGGVTQALSYRRRRPALSLPDCFALALAVGNRWILPTGDAELRRLANRLPRPSAGRWFAIAKPCSVFRKIGGRNESASSSACSNSSRATTRRNEVRRLKEQDEGF